MSHRAVDFSRRALLSGMGAVALGTASCRSVKTDPAPDSTSAVSSPNRMLRVTLSVPHPDRHEPPSWDVRHDEDVVLLPSTLGLRLADGHVLGPGALLLGESRRSVNRRWRPPYGFQHEYPERYEELTLRLKDPARAIEFDVVARAYDEGVALRYVIRGPAGGAHAGSAPGGALRLSGEATHFRFIPAARLHASRDEGEYSFTSVRDLAPVPHPELTSSCDSGPLADTPVTVWLPNGLTVVVSESDRLKFPRLMLRSSPDDPDALVTHLMRYPGRATGYSGPGTTAAEDDFEVPLPFATPWRVLIVGSRDTEVIERAGLIQTLASPCELRETEWIRPGRAIRSFRDNTTAGGIACVDFAVQRKLEYVEFDAHWYGDGTDPSDATVPIPQLDIARVVEYARARGIGVILYVDRVPAMRQLDDILQTYSRWGIAGIKFGFIWEGRKSDVEWIHQVVKKCGEARLLVNMHDNLRPAGLERTLPNYVSLEGVRGNEQFPSARHNVTLPFTRNVAGPIDYTICYANERNRTTNAHQLAMAVVYYSPLSFLYWYDKPEKYGTRAWPELDFFDECPTTWDETRALSGQIGEYVVITRRRGQRWFLGAMTNESARVLEVPLSFLGPGVWRATIYADGTPAATASETRVNVSLQNVVSRQKLRLSLAPSGGQAVRFERTT
jgi:alpha-glucosidase